MKGAYTLCSRINVSHCFITENLKSFKSSYPHPSCLHAYIQHLLTRISIIPATVYVYYMYRLMHMWLKFLLQWLCWHLTVSSLKMESLVFIFKGLWKFYFVAGKLSWCAACVARIYLIFIRIVVNDIIGVDFLKSPTRTHRHTHKIYIISALVNLCM